MPKKTAVRKDDLKPVFENLEPRMLFSADPLGVAIGAMLADNEADPGDELVVPTFIDLPHIDLLNDSDQSQPRLELVFVSKRLANSDQLVSALSADDDDTTRRLIYFIDDSADSIQKITNTLVQYSDIDAVHFLTHGTQGNVLIGSDILNGGTLANYSDELLQWREVLSDDAELLFYACDLASGQQGKVLVNEIASLTDAKVSASDDLTGHQNHGANWELEYSSDTTANSPLSLTEKLSNWESLLSVIEVTTDVDRIDAPDLSSVAALLSNPGNDGAISLREAIRAADANADADVIFLQAENYVLDLNSGVHVGDLEAEYSVSIYGKGLGETTISGIGTDRLFSFTGGNSSVEDLELVSGRASTVGGAIYVSNSVLSLNNVLLSNNVTLNGEGGAVFAENSSTLNFDRVTLTNNDAGISVAGGANGGAVFLDNSTINLEKSRLVSNTGLDGGAVWSNGLVVAKNSSFINNTASGDGGAVYNSGSVDLRRNLFSENDASNGGALSNHGTAVLRNSVFTLNEAVTDGGAIENKNADISIDDTTIVRNMAGDDGGGIDRDGIGGTATIKSSIIALNTAPNDPQLTPNMTSLGYNLISNTTWAAKHYTDILDADPKIAGGLSDEGGYFSVVALLPGSPAIDSGAGFGGTDATHAARNEIRDIGAVEFRQSGETNKLFWGDFDEQAIFRGNSDGTADQRILDSLDGIPLDIEVDLPNGKIYWVESTAIYGNSGALGSLFMADLDGSDKTELVSNLFNPMGLALDIENDRIFVSYDATAFNNGLSNNAILAFDISSLPATSTTIAQGNVFDSSPDRMVAPADVEYDATSGLVYWADLGITILASTENKGIQSTDPDVGTSSMQDVLSLPNGSSLTPLGLVVLNGGQDLYWTDGVGVTHTDLSSGSPVNNSSGSLGTAGVIRNIEYDSLNDHFFVTDASGKIHSLSRDLTTLTDIGFNISHPIGLAIGTMSVPEELPSIETNLNVHVLEGGEIQIDRGNLAAYDADSALVDLTYTVDTLNSTQHGTLVDENGDAINSFTQLDLDQGHVFYQHDGGEDLADQFEFSVADADGNQTSDATFNITIAPQNDSPVIASITLPGVLEDLVSPGFPISSLYSATFTDSDTGSSLAGLAIEGNPSLASEGTWEFLVAGDTNWVAVGAVSPGTALVLDATTRLRFTPASNWNGISQSLSVRAMDDSYAGPFSSAGTNQFIDATIVPSGTVGFLSNLQTLSAQIDAVNDVPSMGNAQLPDFAEDTTNPPSATVLDLFGPSYSDVEGSPIQGVAITANAELATSGSWQYSTDGTTWFDIGPVNSVNALLLGASTEIRFSPASNYHGDPSPLSVRGVDDSYVGPYTSGPTHATLNVSVIAVDQSYSAADRTLSVSVLSVNDIPAVGDASLPTYLEDASIIPSSTIDALFGSSYADVESASIAGIAILSNTESVTSGSWQYSTDGTTWRDIGSVTTSNALLLNAGTELRFQAAGNFNGTPDALVVRAIDDSYTLGFTNDLARVSLDTTLTSPSQFFSSADRSLSISVTAVNDIPSIANATLVTFEEDAPTLSSATVADLFSSSFSDVDGGTIHGIVVTENTEPTASGRWQYSNDGVSWFDVDVVSASSGLLLNATTEIRFAPEQNYHGSPASLTVRGVDNSYTGAFSAGNSRATMDVTAVSVDQSFSAVDRTLSVSISSVSDAPITYGVFIPLVEDQSHTFSAADFQFSDVDDDGLHAVVIDSLPLLGNLELSGNAVTQNQTILAGDIGNLIYTPPSQYSGLANPDFTYHVIDTGTGDGGGPVMSSIPGVISFAMSGVNDAPTIGHAALPSVLEDTSNPSGADISTLLLPTFLDDDVGGSLQAIAIVANPSNASEGIWQYSIDGLSWSNVGAVSDSNALVLSVTSSVRFLPAANYHGSPDPLSVVGLDDTYSGAVSSALGASYTDSTVRGGSTAISGNVAELSVSVLSVNDSPTASDAALADVLEDSVNPNGATIQSLFQGNYLDVDGSFAGVAIVSNLSSVNGEWEYSVDGSTWQALGSIDNTTALILDTSSLIRFLSAENYHGTPDPLLVRAIDDSYSGLYTGISGSVKADLSSLSADSAFSQQAYLVTTSVLSVSDAPKAQSDVIDIVEGGSHTFSANDFGFSDLADGDVLKNITIVAIPIAGNLTLDGNPVLDGDVIAADLINKLIYTPELNDDGNVVRAIEFTVTDSGSTDHSGLTTSVQSYSLELRIVAVNDAPTITSAQLPAIGEDTFDSPGHRLGDLFLPGFSDPDTNASLVGLAVVGNQSIASEGVWEYSIDGVDWQQVGVRSETQALILDLDTLIRFSPATNFYGNPGELQIRAVDNTYSGALTNLSTIVATSISSTGGASAFSAVPVSLETTVIGINDPPVIGDVQLAPIDEDDPDPAGSLLSDLYQASYHDADDPMGSALKFAIVDIAPGNPATLASGAWQYSTDGVTWLDVGDVSPIDSLVLSASSMVRFLPDTQSFGVAPSLSVKAIDDTSTVAVTIGASRVTIDTGSFAPDQSFSVENSLLGVEVNAIADRPIGADKTIEVIEDQPLVLQVEHFGFSDSDPTDLLQAVLLEQIPANGFLTLDGIDVIPGQIVLIDDIENGHLVYQPRSDEFGENYDNLEFKVIDDSAAAGGLDTALAHATLTFNVEAVNDQPSALAVSNLAVLENSVGESIGDVTVTDVDPGDQHLVTVDDPRFEIANGQLILKPGVSLNYETETTVTLNLTAVDAAGSSFNQAVLLEVQDVNDAPVETSSSTEVSESAPFSFSIPDTLFVDEDSDELTLSVSMVDGSPVPDWLVFNEATSTISVSAGFPSVTSLALLITATDTSGESAEHAFDLVLEPSLAAANPTTPMASPVDVENADDSRSEEPEQETEESVAAPSKVAEPVSEFIDIEPKPEIAQETIDFLVAINSTQIDSESVVLEEIIDDVQTVESSTALLSPLIIETSEGLDRLLRLSDLETEFMMSNLSDQLDGNKQSLSQSSAVTTRVLGTSVTLSSGLSVGYILWLIRGGTLVGSVLSALPAWRFIDPLPVLDSLDDGHGDGDDESLESMVSEESSVEKTDSEASSDHRGNDDIPAPK